jgi:N-acetylgalactosamine kinase
MPVSHWREVLIERPEEIRGELIRLYGDRPDLVDSREERLAEMLGAYSALFGNDPHVVVARAPGRVNLMGRHIDHRGGYINTIAIHNDVWIVAGAREDDRLMLHNLQRQFAPAELDGAGLARAAEGKPWREFVESGSVTDYLRGNRGAWANYGLGAWLRLRREFGERIVRGINAVYWGDVPVSVGLSSSSSVFVTTAMALAGLSGESIDPETFIRLCGEGEWFVGTRGGAGDHASMIYGRRNMLSQMAFFPIRLERRAPIPREIEIVLCNSGQRAEKSRHARDRFNARVAAYEIGLAVLRQTCPQWADRMEHLRDVSPEHLGVDDAAIYRALKTLPVWMTRREAERRLPVEAEAIETWFSSHDDHEGGYPLRDVLMFGISECERSRQLLPAMEAGDFEQIRRLFTVSHDGDRVSRVRDGRRLPWGATVDDNVLDALIERAESDDPGTRQAAALYNQPGAYGCSTPEIDEMVDICEATHGVIGAQLVGAGLGGSIVVLARRGTSAALTEALTRGYYIPRRLEPEVRVFQPVAGAACFQLP